MDYPVIDPAGTGANLKRIIRDSGNTVAGIVEKLGLSDKSTVYKWLRGDALPGIDSLYALSVLLGVTMNDILVAENTNRSVV